MSVPAPAAKDRDALLHTPRVLRFGTGSRARQAATGCADTLWRNGAAARAVFRPDLDGWVVLVFGPLRRREPTASAHT